MLSVYKKELRLYFVTATGYVFLAFMLLSAGLYTSLVNFVYYSAAFEYVVKDMCFVPVSYTHLDVYKRQLQHRK